MSFPYMNAKTNSNLIVGIAHGSVIALWTLPSGAYNLFSVPGIVDVSALEVSIGMMHNAADGRGKAASGNAGYDVGLVDGGTTGDLTARTALFQSLGGSVGTNLTQFASTIPFDVAGTSTTDLDADDWINVVNLTATTANTSFGVQEVTVGYIYGKPSGVS